MNSAYPNNVGDQAAVRLSDTTSYWRNRSLTPTQVFKVAMTYTTRFDPKGRGANDQEQQWGFQRLTWGDRKAVINVDILARPWVSGSFLTILESIASQPFQIKIPGRHSRNLKDFFLFSNIAI